MGTRSPRHQVPNPSSGIDTKPATTLRLPGFTADASLYRSKASYRTAGIPTPLTSEKQVPRPVARIDAPAGNSQQCGGVKDVTVWLNAFIPGNIPGYTMPVPGAGTKTMIPPPVCLGIPYPNDCFYTDQRTFDSTMGASSRIHSIVTLDLIQGILMPVTTFCDQSHAIDCNTGAVNCGATGIVQQDAVLLSPPTVSPSGKIRSFNLKGGAGNPCVAGAPEINYNGTVTITELPSGQVEVSFSGSVEPFPAFEMYASVDNGPAFQVFKTFPEKGITPCSLVGDPSVSVNGSVRLGIGCPSCQNCQNNSCIKVDCGNPCLVCKDDNCVPTTCGDCESCDPITGQCVTTCGSCQQCVNGVCVDCQFGTICCDGECVDYESDWRHCGGCGNTCKPPNVCANGQCGPRVGFNCPGGLHCLQCGLTGTGYNCTVKCVSLAERDANCTFCGYKCPEGETCCNDGCVDLKTDNQQNCGRCNNRCIGGQICKMGVCECPVGETFCGSECVNLLDDGQNCGDCGSTCNTDAGQFCCDGACNDFQSDDQNCGSCGHACSGGHCYEGQCVCPPDQTLCSKGGNAQCVDLLNDDKNCGDTCASATDCSAIGQNCCYATCVDYQTDPRNCGGCGHACPDGQSCCHGVCKDLQDDVSNCGHCDHGCIGGQCNGGVCYCPSGESKCSDGSNDKCVNFQNDGNNCGGCGNTCTVVNGAGVCINGSCVIASCNTGYADCNGTYSDGCEIDLTNNDNNCGHCGISCTGGKICVNSTCVCPSGRTECKGICCPLGGPSCCHRNGDCCAVGGVCSPKGGCCDPPNTKMCPDNDFCLPQNYTCCGANYCTPQQTCCKGVCCSSGVPCCHIDGSCCKPGATCCPGGGCCDPPNTVCTASGCTSPLPAGSSMCPDGKHYCPAGSTCCADNSVCCDTSNPSWIITKCYSVGGYEGYAGVCCGNWVSPYTTSQDQCLFSYNAPWPI